MRLDKVGFDRVGRVMGDVWRVVVVRMQSEWPGHKVPAARANRVAARHCPPAWSARTRSGLRWFSGLIRPNPTQKIKKKGSLGFVGLRRTLEKIEKSDAGQQ